MKTTRRRLRAGASGFTLIELMVVVGIIAIMSVVALPAIARFIRTYRIRGAAQQVAGELSRARGRAVATNANFGVLFLTGLNTSDSQYQVWTEDDPDPAVSARTALASGQLMRLPQGIHFNLTAGATWAGRGIRFNRLGRACATGLASCQPDPVSAAPTNPYVQTAPAAPYAGTYTICLRQDNSPLRAIIVIQPGGITRVAPTFTSPCP